MHRPIRWIASQILLATLIALLPGAASADPKLYHSPGSTGDEPTSTPDLPIGGVETLYLFLDPGPVPTSNGGTLCNAGGGLGGNGDETCGVHFELSVSGGLSIVSFSPDVGIVETNMTSDSLSVAIVTTSAPLAAVVPTRIGTVDIDTSGAQVGTGRLVMLQTVDADLELQTGGPRDLFQVPEPGLPTMLLAGVALLSALCRARVRRERA